MRNGISYLLKKKLKLMKNNPEYSEISSPEWLSLNQFLYEIKQIDSACVSVYYPYGKGQETISLLQKTKRKESFEKIESKIENKITDLKENPSSAGKFTKTLCIFGWIKNGKVNIKAIGTSKKLPYIYMVSKKQASATNQPGSLIWPLVLFIGSGILDTLLKYSQEKLIPENELELFTPTAFSAAFVFGSIALLVTKKAPKLKSITWGVVLGVPNYFSILVLLYALSYNGIESSVIFPINNMGIVLVSALVSFIWFKEHFSRKNWIGIAVAILSISFIAFS